MEQELVIECIGSISLILLKYKTENKVFLKRKVHESELMEGKLVKEDLVEMVSDKKGIFYCVLRTIIKEKDLSFEFE